MDNDKFIKKLSKLAKWYYPIQSDTSGALRKPMPLSEVNPDMGPVIDELTTIHNCEWCTKEVKNQEIKIVRDRKKQEWIQQCRICKLYNDNGELTPIDPRTKKE